MDMAKNRGNTGKSKYLIQSMNVFFLNICPEVICPEVLLFIIKYLRYYVVLHNSFKLIKSTAKGS